MIDENKIGRIAKYKKAIGLFYFEKKLPIDRVFTMVRIKPHDKNANMQIDDITRNVDKIVCSSSVSYGDTVMVSGVL